MSDSNFLKHHSDYSNLEAFLQAWEFNYIAETKKVNLFNSSWVKKWNTNQIKEFIRIFYHARGHFHDFLWYLANHTDNKKVKDVVLSNIGEELNGTAKSHEQLYLDFALEFDVDLKEELIKERYYLPFIKEFNKGHLKWLAENDEDGRVSAFSAYEKLDNIDYNSLVKVAEDINTSRKGLLFFKIHTRVEHFESTFDLVKEAWERSPDPVRRSFNFITSHQLTLWYNISSHIESISNL